MPFTRRFALSPIALACLAFASAAAQAQQAAPAADETVLPTVVISASADASAKGLPAAYAGGQVARGGRAGLLGNVDIMDAPFNSTNYTQALIQDQQARGVADVLQNDPSVRVARGFGNFQELYVIRGFAVNSDDLAYNGLYGLLPRQFVASELLERVEVFRGASSFLNGAAPGGGGIGGNINLLPKRAGNTDLTQLTVGVESGGQAYAAADIGRRFGPGNRAGVRLNAVRRDGDTAIDREQRTMNLFSVGVDYRGNNWRLSADAGFQDHALKAPRPSVTPAGGIALPAAPDASSNFAQTWTRSDERNRFATLRAEFDLAPDVVAWAAVGARVGNEFNLLASPNVSSTDGSASMYRFDNVRRDTVQTGEVGVRGKLRTGSIGHTLSATLSGYALASRNAYALSNWAGFPTNIYRPSDSAMPTADFFVGGAMHNPLITQKSRLSSFAVADTIALANDTLLITIGARFQSIKDYGYDYTTGAATPGAAYDENEVTPVAAIVYKATRQLSLYANYIEALQKGPVAAGANIDNNGAIFAPFTSRQKEVGIKYDGGKLGMSAALFTTGQPSAYVVGRQFGVFGEQRNRGLELSMFGAPVRGIRLLGGLTLLDAEQRVTFGGINQGKDAIGVPDTQFNLGAEWDVAAVPGLTLTARTLSTSTQYADEANTQELPSWSRLDLGASYATRIADRSVTFRARIDNAADKNYWASAGGYPKSNYLVLGAPRTVVLSASVDY
jgi:iron complex outermembrane receptor protein